MVRVSHSAPWHVRLSLVLATFAGFMTWTSAAYAFQKTDIIKLDNGDEITCEIKELERGRLRCKTDAMGTVYIKWEHIVHITTDKTLEVETESGRRFFGAMQPGETDEEMNVMFGAASTTVLTDEVAFVREIDPTFWGKVDGSIDFGLTFTQAETQTDYSLNIASRYTGRTNTVSFDVSSLLKIRGEETTTNRQTFAGTWLRQMKYERWFLIATTMFEHNAELELDLRGTGGYGAGRFLAQTNRWTWAAYATGVFSHEQYAGEESATNSVEAGIGSNLQVFMFGDHETDVSTGVLFLPSLTETGRYRFQITAKLKREFLKDLYFSVDLFESYDSAPPRQGAQKNDFGITTALGWSF